MKKQIVLLVLLLINTNVGRCDNRLQDYTRCDMIEDNIVINSRNGDIRFQQLIPFLHIYNSNFQGLIAVTYEYAAELDSIYFTNHGYIIALKNKALIQTPLLYQSITTYDVEQQYKKAYSIWEPIMKPVQFQRKQYQEPQNVILSPSETEPETVVTQDE